MSFKNVWPGIPGDSYNGWVKKMASQPLWDSWSTQLYPDSLQEALYWGNFLRSRYGDVTAAVMRAVCYFLNGVTINNDIKDLDGRDKYIDKLATDHKINSQILDIGLDLEYYGNSFTTVTQPITRVLVCPRCRQHKYLSALSRGVDYDFTGGKFITKCSGCRKYSGAFEVVDHVDSSAERPLTVIRWNPLSMDIDYCNLTGTERVTYMPSKNDRSFIEDEARSVSLESIPKLILDALVNDEAVRFKKGACLHLAMPADSMNSGDMRGWGLPPFLPAFRYVIMLMLLDRQTEAAVKDFILPIRLLFPAPESVRGGSDPVAGSNVLHMGMLRNAIETALKAQAYQQSSWQMVPAPVAQLTLGGDGKAIVPSDVLQFAKSQFLDAIGVPVQMYQATVQGTMAQPAADLKMFEQTRIPRVELYDRYLNWYLSKCSELLSWPEMRGELLRPSQSADPNKTMMAMELWRSQVISEQTMARMFGLNPQAERTRIKEEQIRKAKDAREIDKLINNSDLMFTALTAGGSMGLENAMNAAQADAQGAPPPGADPAAAAGGGAMPPAGAGGAMPPPVAGGDPMSMIQNMKSMVSPSAVSPDQLNADADQIANILLHTPIGAPRNQILSTVKAGNKTLYDIAKSRLQQLENQSKQQGVELARQGQI